MKGPWERISAEDHAGLRPTSFKSTRRQKDINQSRAPVLRTNVKTKIRQRDGQGDRQGSPLAGHVGERHLRNYSRNRGSRENQ